MNKPTLNKIMAKAGEMCAGSGSRLTAKRKRILEVLLVSKTPLSAYEVADVYNKQSDNSIPVMSVYRMLDFLATEKLVHKLNSTNKYVACSHIACDHAHQVPQFLICGNCEVVKEIGISKTIIEELDKQITKADYKLINPQMELQCLCCDCARLAA